MKGFTHLSAGAVTGIALYAGNPVGIILKAAGISAIGALLPDIDRSTSKISKICRPASMAVELICGHRGVFHSLLLWTAMISAWYLIKPEQILWIKAAAGGIASHLFLDILNPSGVPLLWPLKKRFSLAKLKSGGLTDFLLGAAFAAILIYQIAITLHLFHIV